MENANPTPKRLFKVYTIVEKPELQKNIWLEIGVGGENRDGSFRAKLDALPVNGMIQLRDYDPRGYDNKENQEQKPRNER